MKTAETQYNYHCHLKKNIITFVLSFPEGIRANRFSTNDSLVKPSPSAEISKGPFRAISPRAVHAAKASSALLLSRKDPGWARKSKHGDSQEVSFHFNNNNTSF